MARPQFSALEELSHDMERVFDSVLGRTVGNVLRGGSEQRFLPPLDVSESDQAIEVRIDLPGVQPDAVNVEVLDGQLVISGERKLQSEPLHYEFLRSERAGGPFRRQVPLTGDIDVEKIEATYALGVLLVTVPKLAPKQPTKIPIRTAE